MAARWRPLACVLDIVICITIIGAATITLLMAGAVLTHIKYKDTFRNTIASVSMLLVSILMISMI